MFISEKVVIKLKKGIVCEIAAPNGWRKLAVSD